MSRYLPTHCLAFFGGHGGHDPPEYTFVMLCEEGPAYTREEWAGVGSAAWVRWDDGWLCEGKPTPGDQVGVVLVSELTENEREAYAWGDEEGAAKVHAMARAHLSLGDVLESPADLGRRSAADNGLAPESDEARAYCAAFCASAREAALAYE